MDDTGVLVVGQLARDLVLRIPELPEAGGSTEAVERQELLGGKGANQAVGLRQLGASRVAVLGVLGEDPAGERALEQARADGLDVTHVVRRGRTALLLDLVTGSGDRRLVEDVPDEALLTVADAEGAARGSLLDGVDTVCLQLQQPAEALLPVAARAQEHGVRVVLDGAVRGGPGHRLLELADVVRMDAVETGLSAGVEVGSWADARAAAAWLLSAGPSVVALTVPGRGDLVAWAGGERLVEHEEVDVVDVTGGGDAFVAGMVTALRHGATPAEAGELASAAAGRVVQTLGGRPALSGLRGT